MIKHSSLSDRVLRSLIKSKNIAWGANKNLKIYGTLACKSGKRMKKENRVFFTSENDALAYGYRPCGNCMREKYLEWKLKF